MTSTLQTRPETASTLDLFEADPARARRIDIAEGAVWLTDHATDRAPQLLADLSRVLGAAPLRSMTTPGGQPMSVAMSNCGEFGWVSDSRGYCYRTTDPASGRAWPAMPQSFRELAEEAARAAGFDPFDPDACLINRYQAGTRLGLHQDRDEQDLGHPIVSVSLGLPAVFQFGGRRRIDRPVRLPLQHGDVVVWGGPARLNYHGVLALKDAGEHPLTGRYRYNLTFRRAR